MSRDPLGTYHPGDIEPSTLGRVSADDLRAAATWLLDGYEYDDDDVCDGNAVAFAKVGRWLLAQADRRDRDAMIRQAARERGVPESKLRAALRRLEADQ